MIGNSEHSQGIGNKYPRSREIQLLCVVIFLSIWISGNPWQAAACLLTSQNSQFPVAILKADFANITISEAKNLIDTEPDIFILDVRWNYEFEAGHILGACHMPYTGITSRQDELPDNKSHKILVYCQSGSRSQTASTTLTSLSYSHVYNMVGGFTGWKDAGYPYKTGSYIKPTVPSNYSIDLLLDVEKNYLYGNMTFNYVNNEDIAIDTLFFHLFPNASVNEETPGYLLINGVKTGDKQQNLTYKFGYQLLNVSLPQPIQPAEDVSIWINFETAITNNQSFRLNYFDSPEMGHIISLCNFYPFLAVYDKRDKWNLEPLYFIGDPFYSDIANYYVSIILPNNYTIAASGQLIDQIAVNDDLIRSEYQLLRARDFAFAISPDYYVESEIYNDITINIYYLPNDFDTWHTYALDWSKYSLSLFCELYGGSYPYSTYSLATTYGFYGGMEWPGLVYIQSEYQHTETAIAHETAHQWFYGVVGNDQIDEGFIDEGLACYSHWLYFEYRYGGNWWYEYVLNITAQNNEKFPEGLIINRSINEILRNDLDPGYYWQSAYYKAPSVLHLLRVYIGDNNFFNALRRFYTIYKFEIATFNDLIDCFNSYIDINWFLPWFNQGFLPEVELISALAIPTSEGNNLTIKIRQTGLTAYKTKIPFEITFFDGSKTTIWIWCNNSEVVTFGQIFEKKPKTIDADRSSGYFYTLDLYTMEYIDITSASTTSSVTSTSYTTRSSTTESTTTIDKSTTTVTEPASGFTLISVWLLIATVIVKEKGKSS